MNWHTLYITDKDGSHYFRCTASPMALDGEIRGLQRHLDAIQNGHPSYGSLNIDKGTAHIIVDGKRLQTMAEVLLELEEFLTDV